jgi:hypothetical protein
LLHFCNFVEFVFGIYQYDIFGVGLNDGVKKKLSCCFNVKYPNQDDRQIPAIQ